MPNSSRSAFTMSFRDRTPSATSCAARSAADAAAVLTAYKSAYNADEDKQAWFDTLKSLCEPLGFCPDVKTYKKDPAPYKGHVGDVSTIVRLAVTGRRNTPDLCAIMQLLGTERVMNRIDAAIAKLTV